MTERKPEATTASGYPRCPAFHPDTGLQCERVVPPHAGHPHIAADGSPWDDETTTAGES